MRKERCASAAPATVYRISHRLIMSVKSSKNKKKKKKTFPPGIVRVQPSNMYALTMYCMYCMHIRPTYVRTA